MTGKGKRLMRLKALCVSLLLILAAAGSRTTANAQAVDTIKVGTLTLPIFAPVLTNVMKAREFARKNGLNVELVPYPAISAYYAGFATGEVDTILGGRRIFRSCARKAFLCRSLRRPYRF
jgi:NitT/TauT family transport system substrate-binding protein